jgi:energy-coupling factor transport system ATP-binding protein
MTTDERATGEPADGGRAAGNEAAAADIRDAFCLHPLAKGAVAALRGLTLEVAPGERVVVHGPNGSGKTTLLRVLAGEQPLSAGSAVVAGLTVGTAGARELARWRVRTLGRVDQQAHRMLRPELDVLGNVALQLRLAGTARAEADRLGLAALAGLGLEALARRRPESLSGGEAQRVAVCAALAHRPGLVLADEPTGELDAVAAAAVYDTLADAVERAGATLVLVSHDPGAARVAHRPGDRVLRIRDGRLSEVRHPARDGATGPELLVVDDRGWLRLPEPLRHKAGLGVGLGAELTVEADGGSLVLTPSASGPVLTERPRPVVPSSRPAAASGAGEVAELAGVGKSYDRPVLHGVDLVVRPGELVVVRGRSGVGKSTLLRVLLGLERPDAGEVRLDGVALAGLGRAELAALRRRTSSVVTQDVRLADELTPVANLELARAVRGLPPDSGLVHGWLVALGVDHLAHRAVRLLSGGERQRVAVARALAVQPRLAVLDEPSSQLDEASAELLAAVLAAAAADGVALVVASHDPVLVDAAHRVVDLELAPSP